MSSTSSSLRLVDDHDSRSIDLKTDDVNIRTTSNIRRDNQTRIPAVDQPNDDTVLSEDSFRTNDNRCSFF